MTRVTFPSMMVVVITKSSPSGPPFLLSPGSTHFLLSLTTLPGLSDLCGAQYQHIPLLHHFDIPANTEPHGQRCP